ncbi:hypothetical protein [Meiothermus sp. CFH 77666]|uniref:hypothetical protein n=1 Tax=Meiothermus sp. CFH 77666 TaxID=2817942 RepID=UPI001AA085BC|nr:hypothetical protein [Meiothermus sp. CFH 77666]MBO1438609.1 hypothetical protein [Meiothermus sp. CFH 77666]
MSKWMDYADLDYRSRQEAYLNEKKAFLESRGLVQSHRENDVPEGFDLEKVNILFSMEVPGVINLFVDLGDGLYAEVTCYEFDEGPDFQYHTTYYRAK